VQGWLLRVFFILVVIVIFILVIVRLRIHNFVRPSQQQRPCDDERQLHLLRHGSLQRQPIIFFRRHRLILGAQQLLGRVFVQLVGLIWGQRGVIFRSHRFLRRPSRSLRRWRAVHHSARHVRPQLHAVIRPPAPIHASKRRHQHHLHQHSFLSDSQRVGRNGGDLKFRSCDPP
jgi:hypothetical protein